MRGNAGRSVVTMQWDEARCNSGFYRVTGSCVHTLLANRSVLRENRYFLLRSHRSRSRRQEVQLFPCFPVNFSAVKTAIRVAFPCATLRAQSQNCDQRLRFYKRKQSVRARRKLHRLCTPSRPPASDDTRLTAGGTCSRRRRTTRTTTSSSSGAALRSRLCAATPTTTTHAARRFVRFSSANGKDILEICAGLISSVAASRSEK